MRDSAVINRLLCKARAVALHPISWLLYWLKLAKQWFCNHEWLDLFVETLNAPRTMSGMVTSGMLADDFFVSMAHFRNFTDDEALPMWSGRVVNRTSQFVPFRCRKCEKREVREL